jgi:uncharacterized protein YlbG (UPF0298 family)
MTDQKKALTLISCPSQQETLQEKLQKIKFVNPISGQAHSWKKSEYVKMLALKAQQSLDLIGSD